MPPARCHLLFSTLLQAGKRLALNSLIIFPLSACNENIPAHMRMDKTVQNFKLDDRYFSIPANYFDLPLWHIGYDGSIRIVSNVRIGFVWPTMEGRTKENYSRDVSTYGGTSKDNWLRVNLDKGRNGRRSTRLIEDILSGKYNLKNDECKVLDENHLSSYRTKYSLSPCMGWGTTDIFINKPNILDGNWVMICESMNNQIVTVRFCELHIFYSFAKNIEVQISHRRDQMLPNVDAIVQAVGKSLLEFNALGEAAHSAEFQTAR